MNQHFPENLQSTRDLLAGSLQMHATEKAPAVPGDLLEDLVLRFNQAPAVATPVQFKSWFAAIQSFIARPAFGIAGLALVILGLAVPGVMHSTRTNSGFRGAISNPASTGSARIILVKPSPHVLELLEASGDFEEGAISSVERIDSAVTGARVLVDFATSTITAVNANGEEIYTVPVPEETRELSAAIATAVSRL